MPFVNISARPFHLAFQKNNVVNFFEILVVSQKLTNGKKLAPPPSPQKKKYFSCFWFWQDLLSPHRRIKIPVARCAVLLRFEPLVFLPQYVEKKIRPG